MDTPTRPTTTRGGLTPARIVALIAITVIAGGLRADCGTLGSVAENRRDAGSRLIALPVTRVRARSPHRPSRSSGSRAARA